jgi:hypothetical protein
MNRSTGETTYPTPLHVDPKDGIGLVDGWGDALIALRQDIARRHTPADDEALLLEALTRHSTVRRAPRWRAVAAVAASLLVVASAWIVSTPEVSLPESAGSALPTVNPVLTTPAPVPPMHFKAIPGVPPDVGGTGASIVRMRLPAWSVDPASRALTLVWLETDVLIGADGVARAIRADLPSQAPGVTHVSDTPESTSGGLL